MTVFEGSEIMPRNQSQSKSFSHQREHILPSDEDHDHDLRPEGPRCSYRVFLLKQAMNLALPGLSTYNWDENGQQEVIALLEGDES